MQSCQKIAGPWQHKNSHVSAKLKPQSSNLAFLQIHNKFYENACEKSDLGPGQFH